MIFVTLGTSDYPFTRLLKQIDDLIENNIIKNITIFLILLNHFKWHPTR